MWVDSLRLLRARALFWITLGISLLAAVMYLSVGFTDSGISVMFGMANLDNDVIRRGTEMAELFYLGLFSKFIVGLWLSWIAVILGLISCAPVFPDFMAEGSIGIALAKPVGRLKLFLCKFLSGLAFMVVQVGLFCVIVFFAIRWRVGVWNPTVFLAVPLVTLVFSYLYSVAVMTSVRTKSALASVLAAILVWFVAWMGQKSEEVLYMFAYQPGRGAEVMGGATEEGRAQWKSWHKASVAMMAFLPKTGETMNLMDRWIQVGKHHGFSNSQFAASVFGMAQKQETMKDEAVDKAIERHSVTYVLGTSMLFELAVLGLAGWSFCRKDF
jgi:hypothetical protein